MQLTTINRKELYRYLGYGTNTPDTATLRLIDHVEKELLSVAVPRYIYRIFKISKDPTIHGGIQLGEVDLLLPGNNIAEHLQECDNVVLMATTLSESVDRFIRTLQIRDLAMAAIANSAANAAIEQVCDYVEDEVAQRLPDLHQTFRFSPGYGDLPLNIQKGFLTVLDAPRKIGLTVTTSDVMVPEKSVSAIIGLSKNAIKKKRRGCRYCNLRGTCAFRLQGEHCGS